MPDALVYTLILLALVLPVPGALLLRLLAGRIGDRGVALGAALIFGLAIASALALSRGDVGALRVGDITLLLPGTRASDDLSAPPAEPPAEAPPAEPPTPADAPAASPTARPSATARPSPTGAPSATPEPPSATPEPSPTPEPPSATPEPSPTPEPPPPAAAPRTYTVQPGDTLRSIAEQFGVSVQAILDANDLTPAEADALRVGQELIIP